MSIPVICRGCHARFNVSDKFAGKSGPCPKCKATINVPTKEEEVKVHAPAQFAAGGRGRGGERLTRPIDRKKAKLQPTVAVGIAGAVLVILIVTWAAGGAIRSNLLVRGIGLLLVSPPLVIAGYTLLRNDEELKAYEGTALYFRSAICALVYMLLWWVFGYVLDAGLTEDMWMWLLVAPPFLVVGALAALASLDLDFGNGFFHYAFYVLATMLLRWAAGMGWLWESAGIPY